VDDQIRQKIFPFASANPSSFMCICLVLGVFVLGFAFSQRILQPSSWGGWLQFMASNRHDETNGWFPRMPSLEWLKCRKLEDIEHLAGRDSTEAGVGYRQHDISGRACVQEPSAARVRRSSRLLQQGHPYRRSQMGLAGSVLPAAFQDIGAYELS